MSRAKLTVEVAVAPGADQAAVVQLVRAALPPAFASASVETREA